MAPASGRAGATGGQDADRAPAAGPTGSRGGLDERRLARIRWRCRRGMLENDLILARFLDARGALLSEADLAALDGLLDLTDNELWDVLAGRAAAPGPDTQALVREMRAG